MWGRPAPPPPPPAPPAIDFSVLDVRYLWALYACHAALYLLLRLLMGDRKVPKKQSSAAAIVAYNMTGVMFACLTTTVGMTAWFGGEVDEIAGSAHGRLYGHSKSFETIMLATAAYEAYNTVLTIFMPEYRTADFVGHHATTFVLALCGRVPFLNYYGLFFMGVASVSSVPLCLAEVAECFDGAAGVVLQLRALFALLFLCVRTLYWPWVSGCFWLDCVEALRGTTAGLEAHSPAVYALFLVANTGLTGLQLLWTGKIVRGIAQAVGGSGGGDDGKKA